VLPRRARGRGAARVVASVLLHAAAMIVAGATAPAASAQDAPPGTAPALDTAVTMTALDPNPPRLVIVSGENTAAGRTLSRVLRDPHVVMDGFGRPVHIPRGARLETTLVIVSPRVTVAGRVDGDVIVVGGDLFTHPGGRIQGDGIAIGGGVYQSALASIRGGVEAFRDETFVVERAPGQIALTHAATRVEYERGIIHWPLRVGVRVPSYTRVDGLVLPWGPMVNLAGGRIQVDPTLTYRSHLGALDPGIRVTGEAGLLRFIGDARRGTFTNDRWIRGDAINSFTTLWAGRDTRNYYRAENFEGRVAVRLRATDLTLEPYAGARSERAWSAAVSRESHPWSLFGRDSIDGIFRPNPPVSHVRISSGLAGAVLRWTPEDVDLRLAADFETAFDITPPSPGGTPTPVPAEFRQLVLHGTVSFPTFAGQTLRARARRVTSSRFERAPPAQRYHYLGGGGTIPTMDLLEQGGTELFFFQTGYTIPLPIVQLPFVGSPNLVLRYMTGAAGVNELPPLRQNVGARLGVRFIGIDYLIDPDTREQHIGIGIRLDL
jgi:hypothetical protein